MNNRKLIITWKPDVLTAVEHQGSFKNIKEDNLYPDLWSNDYKGKTIRSERESFRNVKSIESAEKILSKRNKKEIIVAKWNDKVIYPIKK